MKFRVLLSVLCNRTHIDTSFINEMVTLHKYIVHSFIQSDSIVGIFDGLKKYTGHTLQGSAVCLFVFAFHFYSLWKYVCRAYTPGDSFVGYHDDTAASVVLQVTKNLSQDGRSEYDDEEEVR